MAVLNIKNFPDELYAEIQERARRDRRSIAQEVIHLLEASAKRRGKHSILELEGLGREIWEGVDAAAYIEEERASWDE
ncbi:MAG: FitA-like ribbon-helix-helix domain-containing protein [Thermoanaerobaculia bacterium]